MSVPVAAKADLAGSSLISAQSPAASQVGLVVSRPWTGVRQTVLDVICGSITVLTAGRGSVTAWWLRSPHVGTHAGLRTFALLAARMRRDRRKCRRGFHRFVLVRWGQLRQAKAGHSDAGSRLAVARSTNASSMCGRGTRVPELVLHRARVEGVACLAPAACGKGRGCGERSAGACGYHRADLAEGQLSTADARRSRGELARHTATAVFRQKNRADPKGATLDVKLTPSAFGGATPLDASSVWMFWGQLQGKSAAGEFDGANLLAVLTSFAGKLPTMLIAAESRCPRAGRRGQPRWHVQWSTV
jgi:hypothetical protein